MWPIFLKLDYKTDLPWRQGSPVWLCYRWIAHIWTAVEYVDPHVPAGVIFSLPALCARSPLWIHTGAPARLPSPQNSPQLLRLRSRWLHACTQTHPVQQRNSCETHFKLLISELRCTRPVSFSSIIEITESMIARLYSNPPCITAQQKPPCTTMQQLRNSF